MSRLPVSGGDNGVWGTVLNDFLSVSLATDGTLNANTVAASQITDGTITNTEISSSAGIAQSKIANLTSTLSAKAPLASPSFTGTVTVPTPSNTTDAATKSYVDGQISGAVQKANNLSDLTSKSAARTNLGLGSSASLDVGTVSGTVAAGDDARLAVNYVRLEKPSNTSVTSMSTMTADPDLSASVLANSKYVFEFLLVYESDNSADIKFQLNAPSQSKVFAIGNGISSGTTLSTAADSPMTIQYVHTVNSAFGSVGGIGAGVGVGYRLSGTLTTGAAAGTFALAWGQSFSTTNATILYAGSEMSLTKVA